MVNQKAFEHFAEVWKRVTESAQQQNGAAPLRPREQKKGRAGRFIPPCK